MIRISCSTQWWVFFWNDEIWKVSVCRHYNSFYNLFVIYVIYFIHIKDSFKKCVLIRMSAPPAKKAKSDLDQKAEMEEKDLLEVRTQQDELDDLNEKARFNKAWKLRKRFRKNNRGAVIRYTEGVSIRYTEGASIRYRALRIFRKKGGYEVQLNFSATRTILVRYNSKISEK